MARQSFLAVMAVVLFPMACWAADGQGAQSDGQAPGSTQAKPEIYPIFNLQPERFLQDDVRFGWWVMWHSGSIAKTGEYQSLEPSPFFDVDHLYSNGYRTVEFSATSTDQETDVGHLHYYQPGLTANIDYQRFIHQLDHDPLNNIFLDSQNPADYSVIKGATADPKVFKTDLGSGQNYAIRVQELNASFKGIVAENGIKARLDVWGLKKDGVRQVNAVGMCYDRSNITTANLPPDHYGPGGVALGKLGASRCHVLSQPQNIDWTTCEIKPVIEARLNDCWSFEYSRPMRNFAANDQTVDRFYNGTGVLTYSATNKRAYVSGDVPDFYTEMDQLKISGIVNDDNRVYAFLMAGSAVNEDINMNRWFNDCDVRWTNTTLENVTVTTYGKLQNEDEQMPDTAAVKALDTRYSNASYSPTLDHPIDYRREIAGMKGVWRVNGNGYARGGLAINAGYEYCDLERQYAVYDLDTGGEIDQSQTLTHCFQIGPDWRLSPRFDTYLHYKYQHADQPLLGVQAANGLTNTSLPQQDHIVEVGFNWFPSDCLILNATVGIEEASTHGQFGDSTNPVNFDEQNYPCSINAWYGATEKLSFSAGYAVFSNFIAQDINTADQATQTYRAPPSQWTYNGGAQVITFGTRYCLTDSVRLVGDYEWVRGSDQILTSDTSVSTYGGTPAFTTVPDLGSYANVLNVSQRIRVGADWQVRRRVVVYTRYELYRFDDMSAETQYPGPTQTGLAQGILGGISATF